MDSKTPDQRSRNMAAIRARGNKSTEKAVRSRLVQKGIRGWKLCVDLPGKPDIVFENKSLVIFLDGCYWHGCPKCYHAPISNIKYWSEKLQKNKMRDRRIRLYLGRKGWRVIRFWEHEIAMSPATVIKRIADLVGH